jgi:3-hydroxyacyl-[acyl-carrier-protein] dehydratase
LQAYKQLSLAEEYLAEHFPTFPVMPGVLMLEALVQAGAWLIRLTEDFAHSVIVLREAKGVKYGNFVEPGNRLNVSVEVSSPTWPGTGEIVWLKARGEVNQAQTVSARLGLARYNLADVWPHRAELDEELKGMYRRHLALLLANAGSPLENRLPTAR